MVLCVVCLLGLVFSWLFFCWLAGLFKFWARLLWGPTAGLLQTGLAEVLQLQLQLLAVLQLLCFYCWSDCYGVRLLCFYC